VRKTKSRAWVTVLCHSLAVLAVVGLLLAGGVMAHLDTAAAFHTHEVSSTGQSPNDNHTHFDSNFYKTRDHNAVVHCGADLIFHGNGQVVVRPQRKAANPFGNSVNRLSIRSGCDPPPPRTFS